MFGGTWSGAESIRFLVVGCTNQVVVGIDAYLEYACYRRCAMKTPTPEQGGLVGHMKLADSALACG